MNTEEIQIKIKELQEEFNNLNKGIKIDFTIILKESSEIYYGLSGCEGILLELVENNITDMSWTKLELKIKNQYEEQAKSKREEFQARINLFEYRCKEVANELGKDLTTFLKEDIIVD